MTRVKICGLSELAHVEAVVSAGADYIGLVFAASPRQVAPETAQRLAQAGHALNSHIQAVGVFVNRPAAEVNEIARFCRLDRVQLSGDESWEYCREIDFPVFKVVHIGEKTSAQEIIVHISHGCRIPSRHELICLLDTQVDRKYGGTGKSFDFDMAREVASRFPVVIAGGLNPGNVAKVVSDIRPWGVDVSSGVESAGRKDKVKIEAFIAAVRQADGNNK